MAPTQDYDYHVALSFAGEDRDKADSLARILRVRGVKVFYDNYEKSLLWGKNLYVHLSDVYQYKARYCVMFLSLHYATKLWTNHEREAAQSRAFRENKEYILPVRLDETAIPGMPSTVAYLSLPPETIETIADAIVEKLVMDGISLEPLRTTQLYTSAEVVSTTTTHLESISTPAQDVPAGEKKEVLESVPAIEILERVVGVRNTISVKAIDTPARLKEAGAWTDKALVAVQEEDYEKAAEAFEQSVVVSPNNARGRYNLALARQYLGDYEMAIAGYRRAIDLDPQLIDAHINLGNLYAELGMFTESLETLQLAQELAPDNDEIALSVADAYRAQNLYQDAIQAYRQVLILNPASTVAVENLKDVRERVADQLSRVIEQERKIDADPGSVSLYAELASFYLDMRRYDDALAMANQVLALDPDNRSGYDVLAAIYEQMNDRDQAAETYARIVSLDPADAEAWEHLGTWQSLQGRNDEAIDAYSRAIELDPQRVTSRFSLAEAYLEAERYEDALAVYRGLVESGESGLLQGDDLAAAYAGLADTYNSLERYDEAIQTAKTLLERFEDDPEGYYQLATAYDAQDNYEDAITNYQNAIDSDPLNADYYNDLADTLREVKRYDEALDVAQQAISMDPSLVLAYETLAQIYTETNRPDDAAEALTQANALRSMNEI